MLRHLFWLTRQLIRISWTCGTGNELCKFRQKIKWIGLENCRINNMRLKCRLRSTFSCYDCTLILLNSFIDCWLCLFLFRYWLSGSFLLIGYNNGHFRLVDIRDFGSLSSWTQCLNDPSTGVMTDIMYFKDYFITSGGDGTLFTQKLSQKLIQQAASQVQS